jgi:hypothetical protein
MQLTGSSQLLTVNGSGSKIFVVSGSSGGLLEIGDISGTDTDLYVIESASIQIFKIDNDKNVSISGSLKVTGSIFLNGAAVGSGGGGGGYTFDVYTANHTETATSGTKIIYCNTGAVGGFTVTLPGATSNVATIIIKKTSLGPPVLVNTQNSELIDDELTATLYSQYESITLVSDDINWNII